MATIFGPFSSSALHAQFLKESAYGLTPSQNQFINESRLQSALGGLYQTAADTTSTSAFRAQSELIDKSNSFNAEQAAINRGFQQYSAERAMQFEAEQAQKAMEFSERMSNTQFQRAVEDLRKAGLNPILAYQGLSGSSPSGTAGSGRSASGSVAQAVGGNLASALQVDKSDFVNYVLSLLLTNLNNSARLEQIDRQGLYSLLGGFLGVAGRAATAGY